MATIRYTVCDRCGAKSTQENVKIGVFQFGSNTYDLCNDCIQELRGAFNNSIHVRLLMGAKAVEDLAEELGDEHAAFLCGCSSSHIVETLRSVEEHMDEDFK